MNAQNIDYVKIALQNARDNARALRLSNAPESVQDEAYEIVYQLRMLLDDVTLAQSLTAESLSVVKWAHVTIVTVQGFNFELKNVNGYIVINDNNMTNTANMIISLLNG